MIIGAWARPAAAEEPWSDADPAEPATRHELGDFGFRGGAEYRANVLYVNPIALNTVSERRVSWIEHRLRLDGTVDYQDKVRIVVSADALDGVLWGDNGKYDEEPQPQSGTNINARNPNVTVPCVTYQGQGDPLRSDAYGYGLCEGDPIRIRRVYGEVVTPVGLLRVGRQPVTNGNNIQSVTGDGRANRFGFSREGNSVDRIIFGTKPLEGFKPKGERDLSPDRGLITAIAYDHWANDTARLFRDNVHALVGAVNYKMDEYALGRDLDLLAYYAHRFEEQNDTNVNTIGARALSRFGPVYVGLEFAANLGQTREITEAYRTITNDPAEEQTVRQLGARAVARFDQKYWSAYLELDYASGDGDPNARTDLTNFTWAPDMNVGLLMFEHILAFQTARAAAAAVEVLSRLGAPSFPAETVDTRGSFTNAIAIFPQVDFRPHEDVLFRAGVLAAWAPELVVDPVASLLARDGVTIDDDLVNYAGGKPGQYYGTEIDLRAQWRFIEHFALDLEGAILFPGDAFEDENGDAVRSGLLQGRTTFFF